MIAETIIRQTNKTGTGLRTVIPLAVINLLKLENSDRLRWSIEPGRNVRVYLEKGEK